MFLKGSQAVRQWTLDSSSEVRFLPPEKKIKKMGVKITKGLKVKPIVLSEKEIILPAKPNIDCFADYAKLLLDQLKKEKETIKNKQLQVFFCYNAKGKFEVVVDIFLEEDFIDLFFSNLAKSVFRGYFESDKRVVAVAGYKKSYKILKDNHEKRARIFHVESKKEVERPNLRIKTVYVGHKRGKGGSFGIFDRNLLLEDNSVARAISFEWVMTPIEAKSSFDFMYNKIKRLKYLNSLFKRLDLVFEPKSIRKKVYLGDFAFKA